MTKDKNLSEKEVKAMEVTWRDENGNWWKTLKIGEEIIQHRRLPEFKIKEDDRG